MGGSGMGGADIVQAMLRDWRRSEARREARRARRQARLEVVRLQREFEADERDEWDDLWPFPCAAHCGACGFLHTPAGAQGDPWRRDASSGGTPGSACPVCGSNAWVDLRDKAQARSIVDSERYEFEHADTLRRSAKQNLAAALLLAGFGGMLIATGASMFVGIAGLAMATSAVVRAVIARRGARGLRSRPRRWSMRGHPAQVMPWRTDTKLYGPTLRAPLTGRACVAYEVRVAWDGRSTDQPSTWALVDQHTAGLAAEGDPLPNPGVHLAVAREQVELPTEGAARDLAATYLRSRGLDPYDDAFTYYESIIEAGESVKIDRGERVCVVRT